MSFAAAASATAITGTLTRKTEPHEKCSSSRPPPVGPTATPIPKTPAQMPMAFACSSRGKTFMRIESVAGMMSAPPMPITAREAVSISLVVDSAAATDEAPKMSRPMLSARLRPKRSPRLPMVSSSPAKTSM
jgi:hypothetical protein